MTPLPFSNAFSPHYHNGTRWLGFILDPKNLNPAFDRVPGRRFDLSNMDGDDQTDLQGYFQKPEAFTLWLKQDERYKWPQMINQPLFSGAFVGAARNLHWERIPQTLGEAIGNEASRKLRACENTLVRGLNHKAMDPPSVSNYIERPSGRLGEALPRFFIEETAIGLKSSARTGHDVRSRSDVNPTVSANSNCNFGGGGGRTEGR